MMYQFCTAQRVIKTTRPPENPRIKENGLSQLKWFNVREAALLSLPEIPSGLHVDPHLRSSSAIGVTRIKQLQTQVSEFIRGRF